MPEVHVVAVEPDGSAVLSGGPPGPHRIQGIGAGFVPKILNREVIDEIVRVKDGDIATARSWGLGRECFQGSPVALRYGRPYRSRAGQSGRTSGSWSWCRTRASATSPRRSSRLSRAGGRLERRGGTLGRRVLFELSCPSPCVKPDCTTRSDAGRHAGGTRAPGIGERPPRRRGRARLSCSGLPRGSGRGEAGAPPDPGTVERAELDGQFLHFAFDVGHNKAERAAAKLGAFSPSLQADAYPALVDGSNVEAIVSGYDVVVGLHQRPVRDLPAERRLHRGRRCRWCRPPCPSARHIDDRRARPGAVPAVRSRRRIGAAAEHASESAAESSAPRGWPVSGVVGSLRRGRTGS